MEISKNDGYKYNDGYAYDLYQDSNEISLLCYDLRNYEHIKMWEPNAMLDCHKDLLNKINGLLIPLVNRFYKNQIYMKLKS